MLGDCAATIRAVPLAEWNSAREPGKWTTAEIAEHLRLVYRPAVEELSGGRGFTVRLPPWKQKIARWIALKRILRGRFPRRAPAPRETRPTSHAATPEDAAVELTNAGAEFLGRLDEAVRTREVRVMHPYFGWLSARQTVVLLTSHARHHRAQLPGGMIPKLRKDEA